MQSKKIIVDIKPFVPHVFETLDEHTQAGITKLVYQDAIAWFEAVQDVEFLRMEYLSDGLKVIGIIAKPKDSAGKKLPVVIYNRGGTNDSGKITVRQLHRDIYFLAKNGYVVLATQYRGNDGGQGRDGCGGDDVNDVLNIMSAAHELDYADATNLFMVGFSRGAMQGLMVMRHYRGFKAAALISGVFDLLYFEQDRPDMIEVLMNVIGHTPGNKDEEYAKRSATRWANEITTPLLIAHGEKDSIVDVREARALVEKLQQYGKTYEVFYYPDGEHDLTAQRPDIHNKILAGFAKCA